jgi:hypothetical protein
MFLEFLAGTFGYMYGKATGKLLTKNENIKIYFGYTGFVCGFMYIYTGKKPIDLITSYISDIHKIMTIDK